MVWRTTTGSYDREVKRGQILGEYVFFFAERAGGRGGMRIWVSVSVE